MGGQLERRFVDGPYPPVGRGAKGVARPGLPTSSPRWAIAIGDRSRLVGAVACCWLAATCNREPRRAETEIAGQSSHRPSAAASLSTSWHPCRGRRPGRATNLVWVSPAPPASLQLELCSDESCAKPAASYGTKGWDSTIRLGSPGGVGYGEFARSGGMRPRWRFRRSGRFECNRKATARVPSRCRRSISTATDTRSSPP